MISARTKLVKPAPELHTFFFVVGKEEEDRTVQRCNLAVGLRYFLFEIDLY